MLNTVSKFGGLRTCAAFNYGCTVSNRRLSFSVVRKAGGSEWGGDDNDNDGSTKNVNLKIIFDASVNDDSSSIENEGDQSPRLKMIFEKNVDALGLTRYTNFPLPGHVTLGANYRKLTVPVHSKTYKASDQLKDLANRGREEEQRHQIETVRQFGALNRYRRKAHDKATHQALNCLDRVQCTAHECPILVRQDFLDTFPDSNIKHEQNLTVITITEKPSTSMINDSDLLAVSADNDDMGDLVDFDDYNHSVYASRSVFTNVAEEICNFIRAAGFWADFVDPYSGKLFSGDFAAPTDAAGTELALSRFSGLTVESAGSCKIISRLSGEYVAAHLPSSNPAIVVGVLFTSATIDSPVLKFVLSFAANNNNNDNNINDNTNDNNNNNDAEIDDKKMESTKTATSDDLTAEASTTGRSGKTNRCLNNLTKIL